MTETGIPSNRPRRGSQGFSLLESLIAIVILSVGILSLAQLIPYATRTDWGTRTDSTAVFIAMRELEQMLAQPVFLMGTNCGSILAPCFTDAADGNGATAPTVSLACTCAAPPCTGDAGAALVGGLIDYSQLQGSVPAGYRRTYTIVQSTGNTVKVNQGSYEIRWHVTCNVYTTGAGLKSITIAARPTANLRGMIAIPANLRAVTMK